MKKNGGGKRGAVNDHEQKLRQWLKRAVSDLSHGLSGGTRSTTQGASSFEDIDFLDILYPASRKTSEINIYSPIHPISTGVIEGMAEVQIQRVDYGLKKWLGLKGGVVEHRVTILNLTPVLCDYAPSLAKFASRSLASTDYGQGLVGVKDTISRTWMLDASGLSAGNLADDEIERIYRENRTWMKTNKPFSSLLLMKDENISVNPFSQCSRNTSPVLVLLGFLPAFDEIDCELLANEQLLDTLQEKADGKNYGTSEYEKSDYTNPIYIRYMRHGPISAEKYWDAYGRYLNNRPVTEPAAPIPPGEYRELLERRQQIRDRRIQCLKAYTGVRRVNAPEGDALAGNQPLFFRFADTLLQNAGMGTASLVVTPNFLDNPDMVGMRKHMTNVYGHIIIDNIKGLGLNASACQDRGYKHPTLAEKRSSALAICDVILAPKQGKDGCEVLYEEHDDAAIVTSLNRRPEASGIQQYQSLSPNELNDYSFLSAKVSQEYLSWLSLLEIAAEPPINGLMEKRQGALVDIDHARLEYRMRTYFDKCVSWDKLESMGIGLTEKQSRFNPKETRTNALATSGYNADSIKPYTIKPFDNRWCYHSTVKALWSDAKAYFAAVQGNGNQFFVSRSNKVIAEEGVPFFVTSFLGDSDLLRGYSYFFPMWRQNDNMARTANLSNTIFRYLYSLGVLPAYNPLDAARLVWNHVLAIAFSPAYRCENHEGIGQGWPRFPFPGATLDRTKMNEQAKDVFLESSRLGESVANILDLDGDVNDVACGYFHRDFAGMAILWDIQKDIPLDPAGADTVPITVEWGRLFKGNSVLPCHGRLRSRDLSPDEKRGLEDGAWSVGVRSGTAYACLGTETCDIHLNENVGIWNVPSKVWGFTVGGFPVLRKWLSYRTEKILGRPLAHEEVNLFSQVARRIAALLLLGPRLNHNYAMIRDLHKPFSSRNKCGKDIVHQCE